ncbi:2-oxoacid:acceptor oxidoreductase subunit alpha [Thermaerobacter sp. FW80]|uniref:2-oxoacid:acceptor oxidoreductase subunit alpha n=1 Tax=Thermaerobacter sp. FW80 TaxID=2546351 RepID=UPI0010751923|nr:2-oxoacid:acceptor oxidoreductase subunit alpha [Thermaerobacter sp. FW80]QBS38192.1 2-oxoacid:acceptor oxidoreductase subunit alpha [Thermaerobacter sp. FW80]
MSTDHARSRALGSSRHGGVRGTADDGAPASAVATAVGGAPGGDRPAPGTLDLSLTIGGDAGQGVESSGAGFTKALARSGLHVFSITDYRSRIRGGHNFYQIRVADRPLYSHADPVHVLIALTEETIKIHLDNLAPDAAVIYDEGFRHVDAEALRRHHVRPLPLPLAEVAKKHGSKVMMNTAALGAAAGLMNYNIEYLESVIKENFASKGDRVVEANLAVVREGWKLARDAAGDFPYTLPDPGGRPRRMVLHGNHAFALGAVAAGCRFVAAYPMTPGTSLFEWMVAHADELGIVTKHAEDEIAAICMAIGAGHAGARSMIATSGGGFSLMVEALGMAGMVEVPVVLVVSQRGGPSTGLPTRTEQGDLLFAIHASQGEFPRIVLAPGTVDQCFEAAVRAFNFAEHYQTPVIVLLDQFLSSHLRSVDPDAIRWDDVRHDRATTWTHEQLDRLDGPYLRYKDTDDGISPRAIPGHPKAVYAITTDEHDEEGHISEEIRNRRQQMEKRMRKLDTAQAEMRGPTWYGPEDADLTLICWGSTYGPCREAVDLFNRDKGEGGRLNLLHFTDLWPFPVERTLAELPKIRRAVAVEQNYTSQFARLLRMMTGFEVHATVNKFDGRPIAPQEILTQIEGEVPVHA